MVALIAAACIKIYSRTIEISSTDAIRSLPYATWAPASDTLYKKGVVKHDPMKSYAGINIYNSATSRSCHLIDMSGQILHT